jgi:hypothetical protein
MWLISTSILASGGPSRPLPGWADLLVPKIYALLMNFLKSTSEPMARVDYSHVLAELAARSLRSLRLPLVSQGAR